MSKVASHDSNTYQFFPALFIGVVQKIATLSGTNQQTAAFGVETTVLQVVSTQPALVAIGVNPDATAASGAMYLPANTIGHFACQPGQKLAAIQGGSAGTLYVMEGA